MSKIDYDEQTVYYSANIPYFKNLPKLVPEKPLDINNLEIITTKFLRDSSMYDVYGSYRDFEKVENFLNSNNQNYIYYSIYLLFIFIFFIFLSF